MSSNSLYYFIIICFRSWSLYNGNISQSLCSDNSRLIFDNGNGSSPRSANLSLSYHCDISSTTVATSSIEPSVTSITSMTSITIMTTTDVMTTPSPRPINCSTNGIWPETLPGHNVTGFYCYKGTVNGK